VEHFLAANRIPFAGKCAAGGNMVNQGFIGCRLIALLGAFFSRYSINIKRFA
jgi:hypothetical protein